MNKSKYIYLDQLIIKAKDKISKENDIINKGFIYYDKNRAIQNMMKEVRFIVEEDPECTYDNFLDRYDFKYEIFIISRDHIEFDTLDEKRNYVYENLDKITKDNTHEFLVSIAEVSLEEYDHNGNLKLGFIDLFIDEMHMSEKDEGLNIPIFKEGDIVELINYPGKKYKVISFQENNFAKSGFPLHYNGSVLISDIGKKYVDEDDEWDNSLQVMRSEIVKVED